MPVEVAVIVVNWNTRDELLDCVASVLAQEGVELEVVVVDNGSTDDSVAALRATHPAARIIEAGENLGFAEGCNRGIAATSSPWVLLLNSDAALEPGALACLLDAARRAGPEVAALQPTIVFKHDPWRLNSTGVLLFADGTARDRSFGEPTAAYAEPADIFGTTAGAALYRRSALEHVALPSGVLDRSFFMYLEDVDLAWRLRLAGYSARYVSRARVQHRFHASSEHHARGFVGRLTRENRVRMLVKNASPTMVARGLWRTAGDLLRAFRKDGVRGVTRTLAAGQTAIGERRLIGRMAGVARRDVERRWIAQDPRALRPVKK